VIHRKVRNAMSPLIHQKIASELLSFLPRILKNVKLKKKRFSKKKISAARILLQVILKEWLISIAFFTIKLGVEDDFYEILAV
jgi:hypothetical protein